MAILMPHRACHSLELRHYVTVLSNNLLLIIAEGSERLAEQRHALIDELLGTGVQKRGGELR